MEFLKNQLTRIQQQLGGLGASQKMLAGSLVAIIVLTLVLWTRYAGQAEMEPVLDQSFAAEDITRITLQLQAKGITYKVVGDRVMVPADRKAEALADLAYAQLLPRDTRGSFDEIVSKASPFASQREKDQIWNKAKEHELRQVLQNFPGVTNAVVIIDNTERRDLTGGVQPSATISMETRRDGRADRRKLAEAAADLVSGAVANLQRGRVKVTVDGSSVPVHDRDAGAISGGDYIDQVQQAERYWAQKLRDHLSFIDGVMVAVTVDPNITAREMSSDIVDPKKGVPLREDSSTEESKSSSRVGGEAGVAPNTGLSLNEGSPADTSDHTREKTQTHYTPGLKHERVLEKTPAGKMTVTAASVFIPRSYFVQAAKARSGSADVSDDKVQLLMAAELPTLQKHAMGCLPLSNVEAIHVAPFTDILPASASVPQQAGTPVSYLVNGHVKEIALGALALVSLLVMSLMVRKGSAVPTPAPVARTAAPSTLESGEEVAGEVGEGTAMLDGMELDEGAVRAQQMIDQVSSLVKDNPDAAANLVKRWLNRT